MLAKNSRTEWQKYENSIPFQGEQGKSYSIRGSMPPPCDNDPRDQQMIKDGIKYYNINQDNIKEEN